MAKGHSGETVETRWCVDFARLPSGGKDDRRNLIVLSEGSCYMQRSHSS